MKHYGLARAFAATALLMCGTAQAREAEPPGHGPEPIEPSPTPGPINPIGICGPQGCTPWICIGLTCPPRLPVPKENEQQ